MSAPIKVLQLGTAGPLYGAERWVLALHRNLDPKVVDSRIAVIDDAGGAIPLLDEATKLGAPAYRIEMAGRFDPKAPKRLRELIRNEGIEVIHSHGYKADLLALAGTRGTDARTVATPHGWSRNAGWKLQLYEWLDRKSFRHFDAVAPLSPDLSNGLRGIRPDRLHLITNGVDLSEIDMPRSVPPELAAIKARGPVIGYVGQLIARKSLDTLLRAVAARKRQDVQIVLVGEGDARDELKSLAVSLGLDERVHFIGFRSDRLDWMKGFDAFVLPSLLEGIPRCLMEALALRAPVVASDIEGSREIVRDGDTGLLFPPRDIEALTATLESILAEDSSSHRTENGRALIEEKYSAKVMAGRYQELFTALIREARVSA